MPLGCPFCAVMLQCANKKNLCKTISISWLIPYMKMKQFEHEAYYMNPTKAKCRAKGCNVLTWKEKCYNLYTNIAFPLSSAYDTHHYVPSTHTI